MTVFDKKSVCKVATVSIFPIETMENFVDGDQHMIGVAIQFQIVYIFNHAQTFYS